jgi:hypothetical protein
MVKFWLEVKRVDEEVIVSDGGVPVTGTMSTLALLETELPILDTVTVQLVARDTAGKMMNFNDVGIKDMSKLLQIQ